MENTELSFMILAYTTTAVLAVVGLFLTILLYNLIKLAKSAQKTSQVLQEELEPTLKELKEAAKCVNSIACTTDKQITGIKKALDGVAGVTSSIGKKVGGLFAGMAAGVKMGMSIFRK